MLEESFAEQPDATDYIPITYKNAKAEEAAPDKAMKDTALRGLRKGVIEIVKAKRA